MSLRRAMRLGLVGALVAGVLVPLGGGPAEAITLPSGFQEQIVFSGLNQPTNIEFAPDGRIFVAEKGGRIKVFDDLADTTPTLFADLSTNVHNQWDRGLLGLALPPNFPTNPYVYVLYAYDAPPGQTAPVWNDVCADANNGTCVVTGRLSRLQANGNVMTGSEQVLIRDWCQQYPSHSIGDLAFGADGMLYVTGGDGASFSAVDYGQLAGASNPCSDPPGGSMTPPSAEGGALRSQDLRTGSDPAQLDGALLRLDPATGAAAAGNPLIGSADLNARRIVAQGLRNPFRLTMRPGTNEAWISDTGWNTWEEVERVVNPTSGVTNFGWPCYEGTPRQSGYDNANLTMCENLYAAGTGAVTAPFVAWNHSSKLVSGEACPTGSSSSTGVAFYPTSGGSYPAAYNGAVFFADYSRGCIWAALPTTAGGLPSASNIVTFGSNSASPVDLEVGPGAELYYVDLGGTIRRVRYFPGNQPPVAVAAATPTGGPTPLTVNFNATGSTDADPADEGRLTYAWDFTNDGSTDSTSATPSFTYTTAGTFTAKLTVTDTLGATDTDLVTITPGNAAPTAVIDTPIAGTTWTVGQSISFSGHATDPQQGTLPASALTWHLLLQHCSSPSVCHTHFLQDFNGVASGSFIAPDHDFPSYLELQLVATDQDGLQHSVTRRLDPQTVDLTFATNPSGLQLTVGSSTATTPFTRTVIKGSTNSVSAPSPQTAGSTYTFASWSDGGAQSHVITAPSTATTYTATYTGSSGSNIALNKPTTADSSCNPNENSAKAVNGTWNGGWTDKWCSLGASKWMRIDLGTNVAIGKFVLRHAGAGGEGSIWNTRNFTIDVSQDGTTWATAVTVTNNTSDVTTHNVATNGRYVRLNVQTPTSDGDPAARIYEFEVYGEAGPPPAPAVVQGTVTAAAGGAAIAGATVSVSGTSLTTTTAADGTYSFPDVPTGSRTITASKSGYLPASTTVTATSGVTTTANLALSAAPACADSFGYVCTTGPRTYLSAGTALSLTGDDSVQQITLPFPVKFYGGTYSTAWVDTNGLVSVQQLTSSAWDQSQIPSLPAANKANLAIYPFWMDLWADASSSIRTQVNGSSPNRQFVLEWRNMRFFASSTARVDFEVIIDENGTITLAYQNIDGTALEQGGSATIGIENAAGTVALQYSYNQPVLSSGNGVTFTPPA